MTDYEKMWNRLKDLADDCLDVSTMKYDNASNRLVAHYFYGKVEAYQNIIDLMDEMEGLE